MATADEIAALYQQDFGRAPDQAGLDYWMNSGLNSDQLNSAFASSPEYAADHPAASTSVSAPAASAPASSAAALPSGAFLAGSYDAASQAPSNFVTDASGYNPSNPSAWIQSLYQQDYGRAPDQAGLDYWTQQLQSGTSPLSIAQTFLGSDEFKQDHPQAWTGLNPDLQPGAYTGDGIWFDNSKRKNPDGTPWNGDVGSRYYGLPGATGPGGVPMGPPLQQGTQADPNKDLEDQLASLQAELSQLQAQLASMTPGSSGGTSGGSYQPRQGGWIPGQSSYIQQGGAPADIPPNYLLGSAALFNMGQLGQYGVPTGGPVTPTNMYPSQPSTPYVPAQVPHLPVQYGTSAPYASPMRGPDNPMMPPIPLAA